MSGWPTSGSDRTPTDAVQNLWRLSSLVRAGHDVSDQVEGVFFEGLSSLEKLTCLNVQRHLTVAAALLAGKQVDDQTVKTLVRGWDEILNRLIVDASKLTPRSHAFHMRLASKYADYYRSFEQKSVEQWPLAARFKAQFLHAIALTRRGETGRAAKLSETISKHWRESLSARLPGLYDMEGAGSVWAARAGDHTLSKMLLERAGKGSGRLKAYEEDGPGMAISPRSIQATLRFGFAASVIPSSLLS